jgi:hypothetical protein
VGGQLQAALFWLGDQMRYMNKVFLAFCLLLGIGTVTASAQLKKEVSIKADVPHAFVVGDRTLPAGSYTIRVVADTNINVLQIRSDDGPTGVLFNTRTAQPKVTPKNTVLVFDKIGDTYFLSQILVTGDDAGNQLIMSRMEAKLKRNGLRADTITVPAQMNPMRNTAKSWS